MSAVVGGMMAAGLLGGLGLLVMRAGHKARSKTLQWAAFVILVVAIGATAGLVT